MTGDDEFVEHYVTLSRRNRKQPGQLFFLEQMFRNMNAHVRDSRSDKDERISYHLIKTSQKHTEILKRRNKFLILFDAEQLVLFTRLNYAMLHDDAESAVVFLVSELIEQAALTENYALARRLLPLRKDLMDGWSLNEDLYEQAHYITELQISLLMRHELGHVDIITRNWRAKEARSYFKKIRRGQRKKGKDLIKEARSVTKAMSGSFEKKIEEEVEKLDGKARLIGSEMHYKMMEAAQETEQMGRMILRPSKKLEQEIICDLLGAEAVFGLNQLRFEGEEARFKCCCAAFFAIVANAAQDYALDIVRRDGTMSHFANEASQFRTEAVVRSEYVKIFLSSMWLAKRDAELGELTKENSEKVLSSVAHAQNVSANFFGTLVLSKFHEVVRDALGNADADVSDYSDELLARIAERGFEDIDSQISAFTF